VIGEHSREAMQEILDEIKDGSFARRFVAEWEEGAPMFKQKREEGRNHEIEQVGRKLRDMMPFLDNPSVDD
jgi:ketol-acid reductoisomerase